MLRQRSLDMLLVTLDETYQLKPMQQFYVDPDAERTVVADAPVPIASIHSARDRGVLTIAG